MNKLVNCRCGGEAHLVSENCWNHRVFCKNCGTQTKAFYTEAEAIEAWNKVMGGERTAKVKRLERKSVTSLNWEGICTECGYYTMQDMNYCFNCGAKMEWE